VFVVECRVPTAPARPGHQFIDVERLELDRVELGVSRMARIAGLRLRDRWGGWNGEPFTAASWRHISVYEHTHDR
jgi:hypothetical protein